MTQSRSVILHWFVDSLCRLIRTVYVGQQVRPTCRLFAGLVAASFVTFGPPVVSLAGQLRPDAAQQNSPEVNLASQIELPRLVDLAAQRLGVNLQYDAAALRGSVTLRLGAGISDGELWALTNRVLASQGFTTVRMHGDGDTTYSVVRLADAPGLARFGVGGAGDAAAGPW